MTQIEGAIWLRGGLLLLAGVVLWAINRVIAGPPKDVDVTKLAG